MHNNQLFYLTRLLQLFYVLALFLLRVPLAKDFLSSSSLTNVHFFSKTLSWVAVLINVDQVTVHLHQDDHLEIWLYSLTSPEARVPWTTAGICQNILRRAKKEAVIKKSSKASRTLIFQTESSFRYEDIFLKVRYCIYFKVNGKERIG